MLGKHCGVFFRDSLTIERGRRFEEWQQVTDEVLTRPRVQQQLGQLGTRLIELNRDAFLPTVRHREVRVPRRCIATNRIGVLPYLKSDSNLKPHDTLLLPTSARREYIRKHLAQKGLHSSNRAVTSFINRSIAQITSEDRTAFVNPPSRVGCGSTNYWDEDTGILVASRPLVIPKWQEIPAHRVLRGAVSAHELVHGFDGEGLLNEPDLLYYGLTELRGTRVGAIIAEDAIASGDLERAEFEEQDESTIAIEAIRQEHGVDPGKLLNGDVRGEQTDGAILHLWVMGHIYS